MDTLSAVSVESKIADLQAEYDYLDKSTWYLYRLELRRVIGARVALIDIDARTANKAVQIPRGDAVPPPCTDKQDLFFPVQIDPEDRMYVDPEGGEEDSNLIPEQQIIELQAKISEIKAKHICMTCPFVDQCLASAVVHQDYEGVWGGFGQRGRQVIFNAYLRYIQEWRRAEDKQSVYDAIVAQAKPHKNLEDVVKGW